MTWKQWATTAFLMLSVYFSGYIIQYSEGGWWFFFASSFSLLLIIALVRTSYSTTTFMLVLLEFLAMLVVLVSWGFYNRGVEYMHHEILIESISIVQAVLMIAGNPWFDLNRRIFERMGMANLLHVLHNYRHKTNRSFHHKET